MTRDSIAAATESRIALKGAMCGLLAALGYSLANAALRAATETDAILVSAVKSIPTISACAPLLFVLRWQGKPIAKSWRTFPILLIGTCVGQLAGNFLFQIGLGIVGLAIAVPLNLSAMIIGGAVFGRVMLGDRVSRRTGVAIVVLMLASVVLSFGGDAIASGPDVNWLQVLWGLVAVTVSGFAYSFFGVTMRWSLRAGISVPLAMGTSGVTGAVLLFPIAISTMGVEGITGTSSRQWTWMASAGLLNTAAFFMLSFSLRSISVVTVNLLNATQAMLAALMGVALFAEPLTATLVLGSLLTIGGLVVLGSKKRSPMERPDPKQRPLKPVVPPQFSPPQASLPKEYV